MGLFGSIGSVAGGAIGSFFGPAGTTVGAGLGNALGGYLDKKQENDAISDRYNQQMALARSSMAFNQAYIRNQLQWRVEDAKKAGLHPMAVLGISSPQYSGPSLPSIPGLSGDSSIDPMEFGQSLNYASTKAKDRQAQQEMIGLQLEGLRLDNQMKQAQIDQMQVDTLAASIASNQAIDSPASPTVNAKEPLGGSLSPDGNTFGSSVHNLYSLASFGDMVLTALNPDIADSLTESQVSHLTATLARDIEYYRNPKIKIDAFKRLSKGQQRAVVDGRAIFEYVPAVGGFMLTYPKKVGKREVSGKLRLE